MRQLIPMALLASLMFAQQPQAPPQALSVSVNEVIVPVTVTSDKGKFVTNLQKQDFKIFEEGKEQQITYFSAEREQPVVVGFLLDLSSSSSMHWKKFQEAAQELVVTMVPDTDKRKRFAGYLITYKEEAELAVNTTVESANIVEKIGKLKPGGGAALYDAIYMACTSRGLVKGEPLEPRRVLVVIGDGHDNASKKSLEEVLEIAQRNLVTIYGISTTAFGFTSEGTKNLARLADETGGRVEYPLDNLYKDVSGYLSTPSDEGNYALKVGTGGYASEIAKGIFGAVANLTGEVTSQYIIRYVPQSSDSKKVFRKIDVQVALGGVKVRARKGYYPFGPEVGQKK